MKNFVVITSQDFIEELSGQKILIFSNVKSYEEEIFSKLENGIKFQEMENYIKSIGGNFELILLEHLIKFYQKNKEK